MVDDFIYACKQCSDRVGRYVKLIMNSYPEWDNTRLGDLLGIVVTEEEIPETRLVVIGSIDNLAEEFDGEYHRF